MKEKIIICLLVILTIFLGRGHVFANNNINEVSDALELESALSTLQEYTTELDLDSVAEDLIHGKGINYNSVIELFLNKIFHEIKLGLKTALTMLIILILFSIIKSLELDKDGLIEKVVGLVGFIVISTMLLKNYSNNIVLFTETVQTLSKIVGVISPLLMAILIATGEVVTSGIITPVLLLLTSVLGIIISYIIVPLLNISLILKIITSISSTVNLTKLSNTFKSFAMWIIGVAFALFIGVLGLETSVGTSVDSITVKTTQAAVSNLVPVVGKFLSDSAEIVMGASEIIGKSLGVIGIIVLIIVLLIPVIKLIVISLIYKLLEAFSEAMLADEKTTKLIGAFAKQYSSIVGIMIGVGATFIISIGIVINTLGKVSGG